MNPLSAVHYPTSTDADLDRLQRIVEQLAGFDDTISLEWLDGAMTALAAGPRQRPLAEWRERLLGDTWPRTFADPPSDREATAVLQARWNVLLRQLDPEPLMEAPDDLRLAPVMLEWADDDEDAAGAGGDVEGASDASEARDAGGAENADAAKDAGDSGDSESAEDAQHAEHAEHAGAPAAAAAESESGYAESFPRTGEVWAIGFMEVVATFVEDWPEDPGTFGDQAEAFEDALARIAMLGLAEDREVEEATARLHAGSTPTRDELIEDALYAVQDLRVFFVENAARPETRRVGPQPGRNEPCPCGSGLKFKKCHGRA
jgi:uncharacterized protein